MGMETATLAGRTADLLARTEWSLLMGDLVAIPVEWGVSMEAVERIAGALPGSLDTSVLAPTAGVEAQVRRLLEVAHLLRMLVYPSPVGEWLASAQPQLALATPLDLMSRSGGLAYLRDVLRDAWEEAAMADGGGRRSV
jgi:hypothetical protein